jgi:hypothetical protein
LTEKAGRKETEESYETEKQIMKIIVTRERERRERRLRR